MLKTGLCSVTFRKLSPEEIIHIVETSGLEAIEWGTDVHLTLQKSTAYIQSIKEKCRKAGIETPSLGTYYRLNESPLAYFKSCIQIADQIGAHQLRIWGGNKSPKDITHSDWKKYVQETQMLCDVAGENNKSVHVELHEKTLTESETAAIQLINEVNKPNLYCYWQPLWIRSQSANISALKQLSDHISNIHVFQWDEHQRYPLEQGCSTWLTYFQKLEPSNTPTYAYLEFVKRDDVNQFYKDAEILKKLALHYR
ncbi:sugar phosphate isomerase/epimerase family protein [Virgibacillus salexigens]|uniref:Xylose isomerase n=1 Tax=Virgibacillus kapii TaxID=1638645 RepID=A0ABQ2DFC9_9BACI|nr:TIM barrel protein [Virgibacillus kapii]GGJ55764.1 xylose isomerase [Virgibacillus kapii]